MTGLPRVPVRRVMSAAEATELVGTKTPALEPTLRDAALLYDADTGEPVLGHVECPDLSNLRRAILTIKWEGSTDVYRAGSGNRNRSWTFGYRPRKPMMRNEGCVLTSFGRDNPDIHAYLAGYADTLSRLLAEAFPEIEVMGRAEVSKVLPDWRLTDDSLWTSGVINKESTLPYHRDGNNFDAWSAMPVIRRGVRGGHLHLPEYDLTVPCRDGFAVMFMGKRLVHGVTPITRLRRDAYRVSVVYYALRGLKDCHTFAEETARSRVKRTERESRLARDADPLGKMGTVLTRDTRPAPGGAARLGSTGNPGKGHAMTHGDDF